jgi:hypothetical protein
MVLLEKTPSENIVKKLGVFQPTTFAVLYTGNKRFLAHYTILEIRILMHLEIFIPPHLIKVYDAIFLINIYQARFFHFVPKC